MSNALGRKLHDFLKRRRENRGRAMLKKCSGGPYDTYKLPLRTDGTGVFRVGDWHGSYVRNGDHDIIWKSI